MFLLIPEVVLSSRQLNSDEKILVSYMYTLHKAGKKMYAKPEYLQGLLGLEQVAGMIEDLSMRNYICSSIDGKELSPRVLRQLEGGIKK